MEISEMSEMKPSKRISYRIQKALELVEKLESEGCLFVPNDQYGWNLTGPSEIYSKHDDELVEFSQEISAALAQRSKKINSLYVHEQPPRIQ